MYYTKNLPLFKLKQNVPEINNFIIFIEISMITKRQLEEEIGKAHVEMFARYMEARVYILNEEWGRKKAKLNLKWSGIVLILLGIIIYLL